MGIRQALILLVTNWHYVVPEHAMQWFVMKHACVVAYCQQSTTYIGESVG